MLPQRFGGHGGRLTTEGANGPTDASPSVRSPKLACEALRVAPRPPSQSTASAQPTPPAGHLDLVDTADQSIGPDRPIR